MGNAKDQQTSDTRLQKLSLGVEKETSWGHLRTAVYACAAANPSGCTPLQQLSMGNEKRPADILHPITTTQSGV
jgi:hypothetical protein